jgi:hypothetical protein
MSEEDIISTIKSAKWKSYQKLYLIIKHKYPDSNIKPKYIKKIIFHNITHNMKLSVEKRQNIITKHIVITDIQIKWIFLLINTNIYQIKIQKNPTSSASLSTPIFYPYYLILININTRYVIISHMNNKSSSSVLSSLKSIFNQLKQNIKLLESDEDPSFKSKEVLSYLSKKDSDYYIVTESQHQTLGIIDRFIRTLRDYRLKNQSLDHYTILTFINKYNNSINSSISRSPKEM